MRQRLGISGFLLVNHVLRSRNVIRFVMTEIDISNQGKAKNSIYWKKDLNEAFCPKDNQVAGHTAQQATSATSADTQT